MGYLLSWTEVSHKTRIRFSSFWACNPTSFNNCGTEKEKQMHGQTIFGKRTRMKLNSTCLFWVLENVEKKRLNLNTQKPQTLFSKTHFSYPPWTNWTIFSEALSQSQWPVLNYQMVRGELVSASKIDKPLQTEQADAGFTQSIASPWKVPHKMSYYTLQTHWKTYRYS